MTKLPIELVLQIIDSLVPCGPIIPVALSRSDWRTAQLRQWMLVCRATSEVAIRHLYSYCMHISSHRSLMLLLRTLNPPKEDQAGDHDESFTTPSQAYKYLPEIKSIYLSPFNSKLDDLPSAIWIFELFCLVSPYLTRLVINFPFDSLTPSHDHLGVYRYLRNGLLRLTELQELALTCNDQNLRDGWDHADHFWWTHFRKLKRLCIPPHSLDWHERLGEAVQRLPELEVLVVQMLPSARTADAYWLDFYTEPERTSPLKIVQVRNKRAGFGQTWLAHRFIIEDRARIELHTMAVDTLLMEDSDFVLRAAVYGLLWSLEARKHESMETVLWLVS